MKTQFITDENGNKLAVILPIKEYNQMIEELEDQEDVRLFDLAKKEEQEFEDTEKVFEQIENERELA